MGDARADSRFLCVPSLSGIKCTEIARHVRADRAEELVQLERAMPAMKLADHSVTRHVERCEQRRGPVAHVVVRSALGLTRTHRRQGLGAIRRMDLRLLVRRQHERLLGRIQVETHDVAHLSMNWGCVELKVLLRCGCRLEARQMRELVVCDSPLPGPSSACFNGSHRAAWIRASGRAAPPQRCRRGAGDRADAAHGAPNSVGRAHRLPRSFCDRRRNTQAVSRAARRAVRRMRCNGGGRDDVGWMP